MEASQRHAVLQIQQNELGTPIAQSTLIAIGCDTDHDGVLRALKNYSARRDRLEKPLLLEDDSYFIADTARIA